jgi:hypothetical protein
MAFLIYAGFNISINISIGCSVQIGYAIGKTEIGCARITASESAR